MMDREILELEALANAAMDGTIDPAGRVRLGRRLRESEAARRHYVRLLGLSADLAAAAAESLSSDASSASRRRVGRLHRPARLLLLAAAAAVPFAVAAAFILTGSPPREATTDAVAALTRAIDVDWVEPSEAPRTGAAIPAGWLRFRSGLVQIEFHGGATVRAQGPAEIRLVSPDEAFCREGRLVADVPAPARGFRVGTPDARITDRGTVFGLEVNREASIVHVFEGRADLDAGAAGRRTLSAGEGATTGRDGVLRGLLADPARFAFAEDLERYADEAQRWRRAAWLDVSRRIDADPDTILHFTFENESGSDRALRNTATSAARGTDGAIVGARWSEGRWRGKGALEFRSVSDRVRLSVPGLHRSLTLAAWIRVHGLDRAYNAIFMSEGFESGALHWQILNSGQFDLGLSGTGIFHSPRVFGPDRLGQWTHVAVAIDADARRILHYVDGAAIGTHEPAPPRPFRLGTADLGNWNPAENRSGFPIRHFSGRMDEFVLFARALDPDEIRRLYEEGKP